MTAPLQERRRARDGEVYTFEEFFQWYGEHPFTMLERWAEAPRADPAAWWAEQQFAHNAAVPHAAVQADAVRLMHAFGASSLRFALEGVWCCGCGRGLCEPAPHNACPGRLRIEQVGLELLRLDPTLASTIVGETYWDAKECLCKRVALKVLELDPSRASARGSHRRDGRRGYEKFPFELVHIHGELAQAALDAYPAVVHDEEVLLSVLRSNSMFDELRTNILRHSRFNSMQHAVRRKLFALIFERYQWRISDLWPVLEAGLAMPSAFKDTILSDLPRDVVTDPWPDRAAAAARRIDEGPKRLLEAWCRSEAACCRLVARSFARILPKTAALNVATFRHGTYDCDLSVVCVEKQDAAPVPAEAGPMAVDP